MTREERDNAIRCLKIWIEREPYIQTYKTCLEALEQEPYDDAKYHKEHGEVIVDKAVWEDAKRALEQEPCEDAISRQAVLSYIYNDLGLGDEENGADVERQMELERSYKYVKSLSSVNLQPKTGHWIITYPHGKQNPIYECPRCHASNSSVFKNFCPNCGAKMVEPQAESEDKEGRE